MPFLLEPNVQGQRDISITHSKKMAGDCQQRAKHKDDGRKTSHVRPPRLASHMGVFAKDTPALRQLSRVQGRLRASIVVLGDGLRIRRWIAWVSSICFRHARIEWGATPGIHFGSVSEGLKRTGGTTA
jgi:hypothetical protein